MLETKKVIEFAKYAGARTALRPEVVFDEFAEKKLWILDELANLNEIDYEMLSASEKQTYNEQLVHMLRILIFLTLLEIPAYKQLFDHKVGLAREPELAAAEIFKDLIFSIGGY